MSDHTEPPVHVFRMDREDLEPHGTQAHVGHVVSFMWAGTLALERRTRVDVTPGSVVALPSGTPHRLLGGKDLTITGVSFCSTCLGLSETDGLMRVFRLVRQGMHPAFSVPFERQSRVESLAQHLEAELAAPSRHSVELQRAAVLLILGEVDRCLPMYEAAAATTELVSAALGFIEAHAAEPISLSDVAAFVGRTSAHVAKCVKRETGHTVGEWIATRRVAEAATLLTHTDDSIDSITQRVGWRDTTHFIRQFKKHYGATPAAYRRGQRSVH